ncbi:putative terminal deoxynucleotidyl transferase [Fonsecaea pedrosoi]|nr:putative terminal deoxynucleotidyl transferase [Fonsecaea pedrosoi]
MATSHSPSLLSLASSPPIFILPTHLKPEELHDTEDLVVQAGGKLTYDTKEARIFIGRVAQKKRAAFDLRARGVWTEEAALPERSTDGEAGHRQAEVEVPARKKLKLADHVGSDRRSTRHRRTSSSTFSPSSDISINDGTFSPAQIFWPDLSTHILILKLSWLEACVKEGRLLPYQPYIVYAARIVTKPAGEVSPKAQAPLSAYSRVGSGSQSQGTTARRASKPTVTTSILERAKAEAAALPSSARRRFGDHGYRHASSQIDATKHMPPKLHRTTTSELEYQAEHPLPPLPDWAVGPNAAYACCRSTPMQTANEAFIAQLTKIKEARVLRLDDIGVRAYSTSIASVAAYPHRIHHVEEITRLPGCETKIAALWREWQDSAPPEADDSERFIQVVRDLDSDQDLQHLRLFWNIWGVGPDTARKFYFEHGWRDIDDVVEFGWSTLTRVQQIGVKYYDEFMEKIPRSEVESIGEVILRHARAVLDIPEDKFGTKEDVELIIVGGYRRGKQFSGDVDVILSHRDESKTQDLVVDVVRSLETEGWITHTLMLHTTTSDRGQATLPFRGSTSHGHGFDSLDKALCVWQDPNYEGKDDDDDDAAETSSPSGTKKKNPNIHRRVDIIVSAWRTVGCAVLGWSGGTTFQRDIRRFVRKTHGLKFDSSGVRNRGNGLVLDFEAPRPKGARQKDALEKVLMGRTLRRADYDAATEWDDQDTWADRERRLMDGLGIGYRPPEERCTG